jgi:hypothetical protein
MLKKNWMSGLSMKKYELNKEKIISNNANNVFKVFLKIGRTLIPDDHIKLNSDNPQNKEIMKTAIIETYTKTFLWN